MSILGKTIIILQLVEFVQGKADKCIFNGFDFNSFDNPYCWTFNTTDPTLIGIVEDGICVSVASLPK